MVRCRIAKLALGEFQGFISSIVPKAAPISRFYSTFSSTLASTGSTKPKFPRFSSSRHHIFTTRTTQHSSFFCVSKRYYHGDHRSEFRRRWYQCNQWVERNPKGGLAFILIGSGVVVSVFLGRFETIPYSKRTHFVFSNTNSWEKKLGQSKFNKMKEQEFKGRILSDIHAETIRVRAIAKDLIGALNRGLSLEQDYDEVMPALMDSNKEISKDILIRDDMHIENKSRKKGKQQRGSRNAISHLNGLSWEILVVDDPAMVNAFCLPGGKIVVFTGLLNHFRSDGEIATIIGHEVGHAVGRHTAEKITKAIWILILRLLFVLFVEEEKNAKLFGDLSQVLLSLPNSRRMEMEADHIGLLLLASAGYDPTLAPGVYKKLSEIAGESKKDYFSTHPSGVKRAENLSRAKIMEEALSIYRDVKSRRAWG